jgi:hypothetical protein
MGNMGDPQDSPVRPRRIRSRKPAPPVRKRKPASAGRSGPPADDESPGGTGPAQRAEPAIDYLALDDHGLLARCQVHTYRARGPGGQKRNKTDSAVRLHLTGTGLIVTATESRSQHENRTRALRRLRRAIALELRHPVDRLDYRPSSVARGCLTVRGRPMARAQLQVGRRDLRYDRVVSEVLDVIAGCDVRLSEAAALIGITTANLTTFLRKDPKLLDRVNRMRRQRGMKAIR